MFEFFNMNRYEVCTSSSIFNVGKLLSIMTNESLEVDSIETTRISLGQNLHNCSVTFFAPCKVSLLFVQTSTGES